MSFVVIATESNMQCMKGCTWSKCVYLSISISFMPLFCHRKQYQWYQLFYCCMLLYILIFQNTIIIISTIIILIYRIGPFLRGNQILRICWKNVFFFADLNFRLSRQAIDQTHHAIRGFYFWVWSQNLRKLFPSKKRTYTVVDSITVT